MNKQPGSGNRIKYKMIYEELKDAINKGHYMIGSFLPTESQLMEKYDVSRTTIRKAIELLEEEGIVNVCQGRGTEVIVGKIAVPSQDRRVQYGVREVSELFCVEGKTETSGSAIDVIQAGVRIARELGVELDTEVYRIQRMKYRNGNPYDYVSSYVPCDLARGLERFSGQVFRLKRCLQNEYNLELTKAEETIYAVAADFTKANLLHMQVGEPLMVIKHVAYNEERILELTESFFRTDIYRRHLILDGGIGLEPDGDMLEE